MGLKLIRNADGEYRRMWYATICHHGKHVSTSTGVSVRGRIPLADGKFSLQLTGDAAFEKSRAEALERLQKILDTSREDADIIERKAYRKRTGHKLVDTPLAELAAKWRGLAREHEPGEERMRMYDRFFKLFEDFARAHGEDFGGRCESVNAITPELAAAFFNWAKGEYSWETVKGIMSLLSGACNRFQTNGQPNPFKAIVKSKRRGETRISKRPLSEAEIGRVLDEARREDGRGPIPLYALALTAASTGMRLGDVCRLRWADVDLRGGFIDCVTGKTGERVTIPLFERLRIELETRAADGTPKSEFVFPAAAAEYEHNRTGVTRAIKFPMARALFPDEEPTDAVQATDEKPRMTSAETLAAIDAAPWLETKKERVRDTFARFAAGASYAQIAAATGRAKGQISEDLAAVEELTGETIRKGDPRRAPGHRTQAALCRLTRKARAVGKFSASLYGWHSFRTAFVVTAIENGVPLEDVRKIVGHSTEKMTLEYYRPERKHAAERVRRQMRGTVLNHIPQGATIDADAPNAAERAKTPVPALPAPTAGDNAAALANAIQAVLANPAIAPEVKNATVAALAAQLTAATKPALGDE